MDSNKGLRVKRVGLSLTPELFEIIEEKRGLISRSAYIDFLLKEQLRPILNERQRKEKKDEKITKPSDK